MKEANDYSMYEYLKCRDKGDNRPLISYYNTKIRTNAFFAEVDTVANALLGYGLKQGDNIALCLPNIPNAIILFYAANKIGIGVNLIHPLVPPNALQEMVEKLSSKLVFLLDLFYQKNESVLNKLQANTVICSPADYLSGLYKYGYKIGTFAKNAKIKKTNKICKYYDFLKENEHKALADREHYSGIGEEIAAYIHSGGTTGTPKIAMLPNRAINECSYSIRTLIGDEVQKGESMLMVLPMFHIFGLGVCMHSTLTAGARCILVPSFNPKYLARTIRREKATYMTGVPSMYQKLAKIRCFGGKYLQKMKCCYCGGDKLNYEIKEEFDALMKKYGSDCTLCEGYGLTEAGVCNVNVEYDSQKYSVGKPLGDIKVCIIDSENNKLANFEKGEICLSGDNLMSGYYQDDNTTKKVFFNDSDGRKWLKTGDYGYLSDSGHLFFVDRIKRMVKISGMNVFPSEIESIVQSQVFEIDKCCAIDKIKDGKTIIKLFVTMKNGYQYDEKIKNQILKVIKENLMKYSLPREIECVGSLPVTQIGKVDYKILKEKEFTK